jgi:hypothetical protein
MIRFYTNQLRRLLPFMVFFGGYEFWTRPSVVDLTSIRTAPSICPPIVKQTINNITSPTGQFASPIVEDCLEAASISWDFIDKIIYINAREATDRNDAMLRDFLPVFQKSDDDIIRFEAITEKKLIHAQRVAKSQIGALQLALEKGFKNVLILEDDVLWRVSPKKTNLLLLQELVTRPFDVIMFGGTAVIEDKNHKVSYAQTASSYLVNGNYIQNVIGNFEEALELMLIDSKSVHLFAIDVWWKSLMTRDKWYVLMPSLVIQITYPIDFGYTRFGEDLMR